MLSLLTGFAADLAAAASTTLHLAAEVTDSPNTTGLADWLRGFFGPLFLVIVSIVAIFFLFTREITRFAQFIILAIFIGIVFYVPGIIEVLAVAIARAMGVSTE
ncbi:hypothetical protein JCM3263A_05530 [Thermobifida fusca]|jgi:hypothetical protein|uniref:Uncharacterized protein n=2 Tax=Thermobifida fusca TaxID=2021 RepID=A0A9P2WRB1_THEFU|nr:MULTISPECIES: hypothetical protein [Thermobifida]AAZ54513.1 hypothetical protein Tfu_0475 [Thermobifida fusca YX]EOR72407.1 hypothetical protein TM51_02723 [Thermobifida fusca TM51]MBO2529625.1 hypothetical protein [Thermobifida sp.]MDD6791594.1 hypothetical protein [Thermobifida fusca]PPS92248.1 hypothetical protein BH05_10820 [Thermobifida fusca]